MAANNRAPKQWSLTKQETITTFESWKQNLQYNLSLDKNFASFLVDSSTWTKKSTAHPLRGLISDGENVPENIRRTGAQKLAHLELMLGQIANFCPVISRNTIIKSSTSLNSVWQAVRAHFGFQSTGAHFMELDNIKLEVGERPEDLFQRIQSFVEDNLISATGSITHHGVMVTDDEEISPSLENFVALTWLRLINKDLPALVKQRYGTELRSKTLSSIKSEISQALDSLLDELQSHHEAKVLRTYMQPMSNSHRDGQKRRTFKTCPLCKQAGRTNDHFLSMCKFLPPEDKKFMSRARLAIVEEGSEEEEGAMDNVTTGSSNEYQYTAGTNLARRVCTKESPHMKAYFNHHAVHLTLDTGAEISMIKSSVANYIGAQVKSTNQNALQADGTTPLHIIGETHMTLTRDNVTLQLDALVVHDLDVDILAGNPFMALNDIGVRPKKHQISIGDNYIITYNISAQSGQHHRVRRAYVLRAPSTVVWPGAYIEMELPSDLHSEDVLAMEPRTDTTSSVSDSVWPSPNVIEVVSGKIRLINHTENPQLLRKHQQLCEVMPITSPADIQNLNTDTTRKPIAGKLNMYFSDTVRIDPDQTLTTSEQQQFRSLLQKFDDVFNPIFKGYNGSVGQFQCHINMGSTLPPQRKGRIPQYSRDKLLALQQKCDDLETLGVLRKPEDVGITVEYLNPSFLVKKANGGFRLVTAFEDVGRYSKPQPSLMPNVDSTLRLIGRWKHIIVTDLTSAFYQIPLSKSSMKFCGIVTPFRGIRVYTRCAMGMPGSETALEEMMCRVLGDCLQAGIVAKLADDLYCGGSTVEELYQNWAKVTHALHASDLRLSSSKTIICPRSTSVLGWIWSQGQISASPHKISVLSNCKLPENVHDLRSFIGAYKVLSRVLPGCAQAISPLDTFISGMQSKDKLNWSDELVDSFRFAQSLLSSHKSITLPIPSDQLWIVTDGSVVKRGVGATLYAMRRGTLKLAGFFSAKLRKHQVTWLPCEIEALCISASVKHFSPYIIQSERQTSVLTDSKPCVQAIGKLRRGEFSASPRVTSFLSIASRYQISVQHLAGSANVPSDFASRNAAECTDYNCQICNFIIRTEDSVVRNVSVHEIVNNMTSLPFTTRSTWLSIQSECQDLRRTHAHLKQGTRPSRKLTNIRDIKRYLAQVCIARDGLLVVKKADALVPASELIVVPRLVLEGLVTALHIRLDHPTKHQMMAVIKRHFFALDLSSAIDLVCSSCHTCASLRKFPSTFVEQSSETPPDAVGVSFAADVIRRNRQFIFILRETVTSYTKACIISDEKGNTLREVLLRLLMDLHPLDGPFAVVRVDAAPGFMALRDDNALREFRIVLEIGRVKNPNKNPVAEKCVSEVEDELLRQEPGGGPVTELGLATAVARLNSRVRHTGLSSRELWTQRNQYTHEQLPLRDRDIVLKQQRERQTNHKDSSLSKCKNTAPFRSLPLKVGELVYLYGDKDKSRARPRYLVTFVSDSGDWCHIKKFIGSQLRSASYKVKGNECYRIPTEISFQPSHANHIDFDDDDIEETDTSLNFSINKTEKISTETNSPKTLPMSQHSVSIPGVLSTPLAESDVTAETEFCSSSTEMSNDHSSPTIPDSENHVSQVESEINNSNTTSDTNIQQESQVLRPKRQCKRPTYLNDYVTE